MLVDIVSKNGNLLLNVVLRPMVRWIRKWKPCCTSWPTGRR
jgi:hypothetical protein